MAGIEGTGKETMASDQKEIKTSEEDEKKHAVTPIEVTHPVSVDPGDIRIHRIPEWRTRMTIEGDRSYLKVKIVRAAPLSNPSKYICFLDAKDEVICMVESLEDLDGESRIIVREELDRRYITATVKRILSVRNEFGVSYWEVKTDRGDREFVVKGVSENAQWLGERRLLLVDVDGNRFEIPDLDGLDKQSLGYIEQVI